MTCSILVPSHVQSKIGRKLERLAKKVGVSFELIEGTSVTYRTKNGWKYDGRFFGDADIEEMGAEAVKRHRFAEWKGLISPDAQAMECVRYTIGEFPKSNGYDFIAKIAHTEGGNILSMAPDFRDVALPVEMREAKPTCDHCNTRRPRAETFVIRTPEGRLYRVGRNCLADFLKEDPSKLVSAGEFAEMIRDAQEESSEESGWGGGGGFGMSTSHFLACAVSAVERNGFRRSGQDGSTKGEASFLAYPAPSGGGWSGQQLREQWKRDQPTEAHFALAEKIMAWGKTLEAGSSDYLHNLKVSLSCGALSNRGGIVASAPSAYARALGDEVKRAEKAAERAQREAQPDGGYLGEVGARVDIEEVKLVWIGDCTSEAGFSKTICTFVTPSNQTLVWFASGAHPTRGDVGRRFSLRGTVKNHRPYKGKAQTGLSRVKFEALDPLTEGESQEG